MTASECRAAAAELGYPLIVKPIAGAGSADTYRLRNDAELEIVLQSGGIGPKGADLRWQHLQFKEPKSATISFDGTQLKIDKNYHADFPETDWNHPHFIAAEVKFAGGLAARREIVVGGAVADTAQSELTPVLVTQTAEPLPASFENCLLLDDQPVRTRQPSLSTLSCLATP